MESGETDSIIGAGVDYITATFVGPHRYSKLADFGRFIVAEQEAQGEVCRDFRFSGYRGLHAGSASFGRRHDGDVVRLSSSVAKEHWNQVWSLATNITRLDIQVTVLPPSGPTRRLLDHHKQLRRRAKQVGRPPKFMFWYGPDGPEAATIGSRQSDLFLRSYDKGRESKLPEFAGTLRYEAELKRRRATSAAEQLDRCQDSDGLIIRMVHKMVNDRAYRVLGWPVSSSGSLDSPDRGQSVTEAIMLAEECGPSAPTEVYSSLGQGRARKQVTWLNNHVKPSVRRLIGLGHSQAVLSALGLMVQDGAIVAAPDETWSSFNKWR